METLKKTNIDRVFCVNCGQSSEVPAGAARCPECRCVGCLQWDSERGGYAEDCEQETPLSKIRELKLDS